MNAAFLHWLRPNRGQRFLGWLHYMDIHDLLRDGHGEDLRVEAARRRWGGPLRLLDELRREDDAVLARLDLAAELGGLDLAELGRLVRDKEATQKKVAELER